MNLDEIFHLESTDPLVATSPLLLGGCILAAILAGWFCARRYANTNDIEKSVRLYLPLGAACCLGFWLAGGLPLLYAVGAFLCGLVVMAWISNYYFYH